MTYSDRLKDPRWQKKRLKILERDAWTCQLCGDKETTLHIHHKSYSGTPWEIDDQYLITYCSHCHQAVELIKETHPDVVVFKSIKFDLISRVTIATVAHLPDDPTMIGYIFINYNKETNQSVYCLNLPPQAIRDLFAFNESLKKERG